MSSFLNLSFGYIKDVIACILFTIVFFLILYKDIHKKKKLILCLITFGFTMDVMFSLIPSLHNKKIRDLL